MGSTPPRCCWIPAPRAIAGWPTYQRGAAVGNVPNTTTCLKGVVTERDRFDFEAAPRPRHRWQASVIYELHVGGFTAAPPRRWCRSGAAPCWG